LGQDRRIGPYRVQSQVGAGGFAVVWRAFDEGLDDVVAVKVLHEHLCRDRDLAERFVEEARILRRLDSDKIVRVYAVDVTEGRPYFVMQYADRGTLEDRLEDRGVGEGREGQARPQPYSVVEALEIAVEIADCLTVVHDREVVHRDLKPSNVLYIGLSDAQRRDEARRGLAPRTERMLLGDFGIARRLSKQTAGLRAGTPLYMAPEIADLTGSLPVDRRADVYSAAVMVYELLAGRAPFSWNGAAFAATAGAPPDRLPSIRPDVPPGLDEVVRRGLAPHPDGRFPNAWEWGEQLRHWLFELRERSGRRPLRRRTWVEAQGSPLLRELASVAEEAAAVAPAGASEVRRQLASARERLAGPLRLTVVAASDHAAAAAQSAVGAAAGLATDRVVVAGGPGEREALVAAHAFLVVMPDDVGEGRAWVRKVGRLAKGRLRPASALGLVDSATAAEGYRDDREVRKLVSDVLAGDQQLRAEVRRAFLEPADLLKAIGGFLDLDRAVAGAHVDELDQLAGRLEQLRIGAHEIEELRVRAEERAGSLDLPGSLCEDLRRVLRERNLPSRLGVPADASSVVLKDAARRGADRWRAFANGGRASEVAQRAAEVVALSYERLWVQADALVSA
jgi:hypothetical protein